MRKGIVMEHRRTYTIIMEKDGTFHKAKPVVHGEIGEEIPFELYHVKKRSFILFLEKMGKIPGRMFLLACALLLFVLPIYFVLANNKTFAYLSLDINPSFELEIDGGLHVKSIHYLNEEAKQVGLKLKEYRGRKIEAVIEEIMKQSESSNMVGDNKNMLIGVSYPNHHDQENRIFHNLNKVLQQSDPGWNVTTFQVPDSVRRSAIESGKPINEKVAEVISQTEPSKSSLTALNLNDEEKAIIHSFYSEKSRHFDEE
ncbi:anti-sigma-I factor RsgI family protein [Oceanobacillus manasiensis]|uniref:anti-sigma-I factor RsgI family protein n=1 Tax=Oceanobacillus manasiensis TaxID=586413 RepID=UPI0005A831BE|nr:hypothetical protein [Oceanobacillus manasiensis]